LVFEACYLQERMAQDHRRLAEEVVQEALLDDPPVVFLRRS